MIATDHDEGGAATGGGIARFDAMLERMAGLLAAELGELEAARAERTTGAGKATIDTVALIVRTMEKIDALMRMARAESAALNEAKTAGGLSADERDALANRVAARIGDLVEERAGQLAAKRVRALAAAQHSG